MRSPQHFQEVPQLCRPYPDSNVREEVVDNGKPWELSKHRGTGGYSVCQQGGNVSCTEAMMQEIFQNGPITGMFFVHQSFLSYKSGVYKAGLFFKDPMLGGHAIKIMGWGTENGADYWLVANSWNEPKKAEADAEKEAMMNKMRTAIRGEDAVKLAEELQSKE